MRIFPEINPTWSKEQREQRSQTTPPHHKKCRHLSRNMKLQAPEPNTALVNIVNIIQLYKDQSGIFIPSWGKIMSFSNTCLDLTYSNYIIYTKVFMKCKEIFFSHLTKGLRAVQCWTYSWSAYKYLGRANILWPWRFQIENIQHRTETTFHFFDVAKESTGSSPLNDSPEIVFTSD